MMKAVFALALTLGLAESEGAFIGARAGTLSTHRSAFGSQVRSELPGATRFATAPLSLSLSLQTTTQSAEQSVVPEELKQQIASLLADCDAMQHIAFEEACQHDGSWDRLKIVTTDNVLTEASLDTALAAVDRVLRTATPFVCHVDISLLPVPSRRLASTPPAFDNCPHLSRRC